jgi:putative transposase
MVSRQRRPTVNWRYPLHVVLRVRREVGRLRQTVRFKHMKRAFRDGCSRFGLRLCDFSVQDNHIHLIVEADDKQALSRGMQALEIRLAWHINLTRQIAGTVFSDRYYARPLRTRAEVINALQYVRYNWHKHRAEKGLLVDWREIDPFSTLSGDAQWYDDENMTVARPKTWLLNHVPPALLRAALRRLARSW